MCLLLAAFESFAVQTNIGFIVASLAGSVLMVIAGYFLTLRLKQIRFCWALADGLLLGYSTGSFNTTIRLLLEGTTPARYFFRPQSELSMALALSLVASAILFFVGAAFERPVRIDPLKLSSRDLALVVFGVAVVGIAFLTGGLGYMGATTSGGNHASPIAMLAAEISPALPAMAFLLERKCRSVRQRLFCWLLFGVGTLALVPQSRRTLIYGLLLVVIAYNLRSENRPTGLLRKGILVVCLVPILYAGTTFFYALRVSAWQMGGGGKKAPLSMLTSRATNLLENNDDSQFDQQVSQNLRDRTFVLRYFSDLLSASWTHPLLLGEDLFFCIKLSIPSAIYPNKDSVIETGAEEGLANPNFGLIVKDEANSVLTTGVSDFGLAGALVYPVGFCLAVSFFVRRWNSKVPEAIRLLTILAIINLMWQTETGSAAYLVLCRNLVILLPALWVIHWFSRGLCHKKGVGKHQISGPPGGRRLQLQPISSSNYRES